MEKLEIISGPFLELILTKTKLFFGNSGSYSLEQICPPGSSGNIVIVLKENVTGKKICVKIAQNCRVPLRQEFSNQHELLKFIPQLIPDVYGIMEINNNHDAMWMDCPGTKTLHEAFLSNISVDTSILDAWEKVLENIFEVWNKSKDYSFDWSKAIRHHPTRGKRIETNLKNVLWDNLSIGNFWYLPLRINGVEYPSISEVFSEIFKISPPNFAVTCHGDLHPSNIVLSEASIDPYLIDWEWAGHGHDWRNQIAHMYGWWPLRYLETIEPVTMNISNNEVVINYRIFFPENIQFFQSRSRELFFKMAQKEYTQNDIDAVNRYLATILIGEPRFSKYWKREHYIPIFLAEGVKILFQLHNYNTKKLHSSFLFTGRAK